MQQTKTHEIDPHQYTAQSGGRRICWSNQNSAVINTLHERPGREEIHNEGKSSPGANTEVAIFPHQPPPKRK